MPGLDPGIHRKDSSSKWMDCRVKPGNDGGETQRNCRLRIEGPAVIEEQTSTIVLYPGQRATVDDDLNIEIAVQS
jgi:hypothetical protein